MVIHKHLRTTQVVGGKKREIPIVYALAKIMETLYRSYFSFFSVTVGLKEWCTALLTNVQHFDFLKRYIPSGQRPVWFSACYTVGLKHCLDNIGGRSIQIKPLTKP